MLKSKFDTDRVSVRLGMAFSWLGISPNTWTVLALIPAVAGFILVGFYRDLLLGFICFFASGAIDAIDGAVARVTSRVSALGAFLDGVIDRYVEILLYIGLYLYLENIGQTFLIPNALWIILLVYGSLMPTFIRAYADHRKVVTEPSDLKAMGGLLERAERLMLVYAGMLLGVLDPLWLVYVVALAAVLANFTAFQRLWFIIRFKRAG